MLEISLDQRFSNFYVHGNHLRSCSSAGSISVNSGMGPKNGTGFQAMLLPRDHEPHFEEKGFRLQGQLNHYFLIPHERNKEVLFYDILNLITQI